MYAIISKYRLGKAPTGTNEALKYAEMFIERLDTESHPDQHNELNALLDHANYIMQELELVYHHGIEELLGRYIDHGYVPSMIDDPNADRWQSRSIENKLRKEFAEIYAKLAQAANLECRVYRSDQYLIETGEPWSKRARLINEERKREDQKTMQDHLEELAS
tara:strand:+ start:540 stop:1028 length:489 start_codon:yes stop_codon:yes gene_type:complete